MAEYKASKWTNIAKALGTPSKDLAYGGTGGDIATALMSGLGGFSQVRGANEDSELAKALKDKEESEVLEQRDYDREQDSIANTLGQSKFDYTQKNNELNRLNKLKSAGITAQGQSNTGLGTDLGLNFGEAQKYKSRKIGTDEAENLQELKEIESTTPQLLKTIDTLGELADKATYTGLGQAKDFLTRQLGGTTEGAKARTEYEASISNQVLPLLKQTFGAAFTVQEGESLKATLGDVNKSPEEKQAVLKAFITNKSEQVKGKAIKAGVSQVDINDPMVKRAIEEGYTIEEIRAYQGGE